MFEIKNTHGESILRSDINEDMRSMLEEQFQSLMRLTNLTSAETEPTEQTEPTSEEPTSEDPTL